MRTIFLYSLVLFLGIAFLASCNSDQSEEDKNTDKTEAGSKLPAAQANWEDGDKVARAIDKYFEREVFAKGGNYLEVKDEIGKGKYMLFPKKYDRDNILQISNDEVVMHTDMRVGEDKSRTVSLDFLIGWDATAVNKDSTKGSFAVKKYFIREVEGRPYYEWRKVGDSWERFPIGEAQ
ncbi:MAG: hypothetical protein JJT94_07325 [Bernardetiaceae bacterium]|nr:hypothetical protein [Bernardetiaceae bacterium]